jgi:diguanylate cyclase (GGDEF)-like protein/PAS domain S-box-containing protein
VVRGGTHDGDRQAAHVSSGADREARPVLSGMALIQSLVDNMPAMVFIRDLDFHFLLVNDAFAAAHATTSEELLGRPDDGFVAADALALMHSDDRRVLASGMPLTREETVALGGESRAYVTVKFPLRDEHGAIAALAAVATDVTELRRTEEALRTAQEEFRVAFELAPIGMALVSPEGHWLEVNDALCVLLGHTAEQLRAMRVEDVTHPEDVAQDTEQMARLLAGEIESNQARKRYVARDGRVVWVLRSASLVHAVDGRPLHFVVEVIDVSESQRLEERLRYLADHDALTGLRSRRLFEQDLLVQVARCQRYGEQAALLMLDLDGFKQINDTHGHHIGDQALKAVADVIRRRSRASDLTARIGGDEFAILLPHVDAGRVATIVDDLRQAIDSTAVHAGEARVQLAVSIGAAILDAETGTGEQPLATADRAMYADKQAHHGQR